MYAPAWERVGERGRFNVISLVIFRQHFIESPGMFTSRTFFRRVSSFVDVAAVGAMPFHDGFLLKDLAVSNIGG